MTAPHLFKAKLFRKEDAVFSKASARGYKYNESRDGQKYSHQSRPYDNIMSDIPGIKEVFMNSRHEMRDRPIIGFFEDC